MTITSTELYAFIPTMRESSGYVFEELTDRFGTSEALLTELTGVGDLVPFANLSEAQVRLCKRFVALDAVYEYIPLRDLVITPNGFGIVSDANLAPASKDRVEALRHEIGVERATALTQVLQMMIANAESWHFTNSQYAARSVADYIWNTQLCQQYCGKARLTMEEFAELQPELAAAQESIINTIGIIQHQTLISKMQSATLNANQITVVNYFRMYIGAVIRRNHHAQQFMRMAMYLIDNHQSDFADYFTSAEYAARQSNYANKKEDPCYFW